MAKRNLFEYRVAPAKDSFQDDFEGAWLWTFLGLPPLVVAGITTTSPFRGSHCGYLIDQTDQSGGIVHKPGLNMAAKKNTLEFAARYVGNFPNDTWYGEIYLYHPTLPRISTILTIGGGGTVSYRDDTGQHVLYSGSASLWYFFKITEYFDSLTFDVELYDYDMNLLASETGISMWYYYSGAISYYPPLAFVISIGEQGWLYFDDVSLDP